METPLQSALDDALRPGARWPDLRVETECRTPEGYRTVVVHGNGVGIWDREKEFALAPPQIRKLLLSFRRAGFPRMPETYGGRQRAKAAIVASCSVSLQLAGIGKRVTQLKPGAESPQLKRLAHEVIGLCREAARSGTSAASLNSGLEKIGAGGLAAETFSLTAHRKGEREGWLLRIDGVHLSSRPYTPAEGYQDPIALELSRQELGQLASLLAQNDLEHLPPNLYAPEYVELTVAVLNRKKNIQARPFAGMEPTTHGVRQQGFDRISALLRELHQRALREGRPVPET